jgi:hypothetical chaperone protein
MALCGLDFGTSNSTLALIQGNGSRLAPLEGDAVTLPSALFFDARDDEPIFGRAAIAAYVDGEDGRLMRSLKSALGSDLIDQETRLEKRKIRFDEAIGLLLGHIKLAGERASGGRLDSVVHGRPVHFVDDDEEADRRAEEILEDTLRACGFRQISFQYEPIAAALHYESQLDREELAVIADIGGGTSDFSVVRLGPDRARLPDRAEDILANDGVRVGGTDLDRLASLASIMPELGYGHVVRNDGLKSPVGLYHDFASWPKINFLYTPETLRTVREMKRAAQNPVPFARMETAIEERLGHWLALQAEAAKISLSETEDVRIDLGRIEPGLGIWLDRDQFGRAIQAAVTRVANTIARCVDDAGVAPDQIDSLVLTGGSALLPMVRDALAARLPKARLVDSDHFGAIGLGLALEARRRYG